MSQNNPASWTNNEWKFSYEIPEQESGLPGQLSPVGDRQQSPLDMLGAFGEALFSGIFDTLGNIFNGVIEVGGAIAGGLIEGIKGLVGWVGSTIASLFSGGEPRVPPPPIYSEISTDLEGDIKPFVDAFKESQEKAFQAVADAKALRELFDENQKIVSDRIDEADEKIQQVGDVDAKISAEAGRILAEVETHKAATEEALGKAETVREDLAAYKLAADAKIQSALEDAKAGLDKLDALEPRVSGVISDLEAYELAVDAQIQDLLGKASGAITDAGQALAQYDDLLADYEPFKTDAAEKLVSLDTLTTKQQQTINNAVTGSVIEYAVGSSETSAPTTGWSTATPTRAAGRFTWMRTKVTYGSGQVVTTSPALITGNTGTPGTPGTDGTPGKAGLGLKSTTVTYVTSTSGATAPTTGWTEAVPTLTKGRYLWTRTLWTYTDDSTEIGYSVAYLAKDGSSGTDGLPGKDGVGITGTTITYAASSSGTVAPSSGWVASPPDGTPGQFIWTKTVWTYSDKTTETGYTVGKIGNTGAKGATGATGGKGADGIPGKDGVGVKTTAITYALSTSGTTAPTSGWNATVPTLTKGRYLWTKTLWTYTDNSTETGHSVSYIPTDGSSGTDGLPGKDGTGITGTAITYAKSSSGTSAPTTGWGAQPPATSPGDFVWTKTVWTYSDKTTETGYTVGKIGNTGAKGATGATGGKGADGIPGKDGVGVKTTAITYALSTSGTTAPTSGWNATVPTLTKGRYLWTKTLWTYTDNSTETGHSVSYIPTDGSSGTDGLPGKDGTGITGTAITYAKSSSGTSAPTTGWGAQPPATSPGDFVWTKTVWTYSDKTTETGYTVGKIGNTGAKGATGATGGKGADGIPGKDGVGVKTTAITYALSTSGTTAPTSGWNATVPTLTKGRYLWTKTLWTYTDNSTETGHSVSYIPTDGSSGTDGLPGKDGTGITGTAITYAKSSSGTSAPTTGWGAQPPATSPGDFVWTKTVWTYSDKTTETGYTVGKIGNTGAKGATGATGGKGADGIPGKDGVGVKTTAITYALSTSGTTAPTSGWNATVPTLTKGRYLWTKTLWTYTDNSTETGHSVSYIPTDGSSGTDGLPGKDGTGITGTAITYAKSSSGTSAPTTGWGAQPPATSPGDFVWTKTVWTYSDKTTETGYTVGKIGNTGAKGATGATGATGSKGATGATGSKGDQGISVTSVTSYYRLVTRGAATPAKPTMEFPSAAAWSLTEPAFEASRELYRTDKVTYSNGAFSWTDVSKVSAYTASTEAMNTAVDALAGVFNSTDIGSSLVAYIPGTSTPVWADTMTPATPEENPQGLPEAYVFSSFTAGTPLPKLIAVNPGIDYKISAWFKADKPDSRIYLEARDQDETHAVRTGAIGGGGTYLIGNFTLPTEWTLYESVITFRPEAKRVKIAARYSNHANGTERNAVQYMADLRIDPVTVTPADVTRTVDVVADSLSSYRTANDKAVSAANKAASDAAGLAGGKGEVIYSTATPPTAKRSAANLWIKGPKNTPHVWNGSAWVEITDQAAKDAAKAAADANSLAEKKTTTYYQTSAPSVTKTVGDLWIDQSTSGKNALKRWSGSAWVVVQDKAIAEAMAAAGTAQSTADGKVQTFARAAAPTGMTSTDVGDLWIDTDDGNKLYRWSGSAWVSLQDKGIVSALQLAQQGVNDAKAVADKIPGVDKKIKDLTTDQETLGGKAQQGIDDAKVAADLVRNSVDIGTSLVSLIPGTNRPRWSEGIEEVAVTDLPGVTVAYKAPSTQQTINPSVQWVKADPKVKYHVSFWAKASAPGSRFYIYFDNQDGGRAPISNTLPGGNANLLADFQFPTEWTKYEGVIQLRDTTELVRFRSMFWNHPNGPRADQFLADFRIEPVIPSQDDVNDLLIDTAKNHDDILKAQGEINDIHAGKWEKQSALNTLQLEIDENQNTAIQGLTASTMLAFPHMNVAPEDSSGKPWWAVGMDRNSTYVPPGFPSGSSYYTSKSNIINVDPEALITVVPGIDYKLEFWTARVDAGTAGAYADVRDESGNVALTHWADVTDGVPAEISWSARAYAGGALPTSTNWIRKVYLLRVRPGTNKMALHFRPGNSATANGTRVRFWGANLSAFMPIQEQLDAAQTEAILANGKINDKQDGLIALNNKIGSANTEAVSAHQRVLQMAYPDSGSAIPMVPGGVNVGTAAAPVYEAMPEWLHAFGVTSVNGVSGMEDKRAAHSKTTKTVTLANPVKVRANPTALYRYSFWIQASAAGSEAFIRLYDQNGNGAVLENTPDVGVPTPRTSGNHLFWFNRNVPFTNGWNKISGTIRLKPDVTHVYIDGICLNYTGTITNQWLADIQLEPIIPSQSDVNKALTDMDNAQNDILHDHQRALDLMYPADNVIPRDPAGLNVGTKTNPQYVEFPYWLKNGTYGVRPAGSLPAGNRLSARVTTSTTPNTVGPRASVTPGVDYNYEFYFKATAANSGLVIYLVDQNGSTGPGEWNVPDGGYSASSGHLWWNSTMPGGTGPETGGFYRMSGKIRFKPGVTGISLERIYYNWSSGSVTTSQELTGIRIWPDIPSQQQVDEAQNEAAEGNRKSIDALERTVRLAFPHINTLPYSGGNPLWQSRASWITRSTAAANLPPASQRTETFSSLINGSGAMTRNAASSVAIPDDVSELRVRGLLRRDGGFFPIVDLHNDAGASIISAWRRTFPTDDEVSLSGRSEIWYTASSAGGYPVDGNNTDPWQPFDIVIRVKPGSNNFHIRLSSTRLLAIHGLAVFSYYPSQSEVDFAQDRAMRALSGSVDLATSIGTAAATAAENLGAAQTAMQMSLVTTASYIPRVMIINDLGHRSAHERSEHVQVRKDGSSSFLIDARGSSWTGLIVVTTFYGSSLVTDTFEITPGGNRTNGVLKRRSNSEAQHMRIDYWVNPEVETKEVVLGGTDVPHDRWSELAGTSFTATGFVPEQGAALPVLHIAELAVGWDRATHHAKYGVQIKLDGIVVATLEEKRVGPRYPWGEPYAKQVVSWSGQVMPNQKITFEVLSNDTVPGQRRLRDATRLVSYSKGV